MVAGTTAPLPSVRGLDRFVAHQRSLAQVLRLVTEDGARQRVLQGLGTAKHPVVVAAAGHLLFQRRRAAGIGPVTAGDQHAAVARRHDARRLLQGRLVHDDRLGQEGIDQVRLQGRQGTIGQLFDAHARRHPDGVRAGRLRADPEPGASIRFVQHQQLAWVDAVRVGYFVHVHPPQLRPAPGTGEEEARNAPQGVAALDGVFVRRVGRQLRKRHARLSHLFGGGALSRRNGEVLRQGGWGHAARPVRRVRPEPGIWERTSKSCGVFAFAGCDRRRCQRSRKS